MNILAIGLIFSMLNFGAVDDFKKPTYQKYNVDWTQNQYVAYASEISGNDLDFLATLEAENGLWDHTRQATNGEPSFGFCQIHTYWHSHIVYDPRFFTDPYWQLDKCWELYTGGTRFYGFDVRWRVIDRFYLTYL